MKNRIEEAELKKFILKKNLNWNKARRGKRLQYEKIYQGREIKNWTNI